MKKIPTLIERWNQLRDDYINQEVTYEQVATRYNELVKLNESEPKIWHFIPCNSKGEPMEEPESLTEFYETNPEGMEAEKRAREEWEEALKRTKFKGWSLGTGGYLVNQFANSIGRVTSDGGFSFHHRNHKISTYKDIIDNGITLEPTKQQQTDLKL